MNKFKKLNKTINNNIKKNNFKFIEITIFIIILLYSLSIVLFNIYYKTPFYYISLKNKKPIDNIYEFVKNNSINTNNNTKHYWNETLNDDIKKYIYEINDEILNIIGGKGGKDNFDYIPSMTELYYSSKGNENSDQQYVSNHMDGPFYSCRLYRAIIAINGNKNIDTYFPNYNKKINLKKYDVAIFDYDNEPHYININNNIIDNNQRILLKLHYIKKENKICQKLHCKFGRETRDLFELNKKNLYMSGLLARMSLIYNTNRKYILIFIFLLIIYYYYTSNIIARLIIYLFVIIELMGILYILHYFLPIYYNECNNNIK